MNIHKNARLTPQRSRGAWCAVWSRRAEQGRRPRASSTRTPEDGRQMGRAVRRGGCGRACGPLLTGPFHCQAKHRQPHARAIEALAPAALHRQADRRRGRRLAGHRQPHPAAARAEPDDATWSRPSRCAATSARHPGEMIHIDIKKLGRFEQIGHRITGDRTGQSNSRGVGWEYRPCLRSTTHSRLAFSQVMPDEKAASAVAFLKAAVAYYASLGVTVTRVMTDNGSCYRSFAFRKACARARPQAHPHQALHAQDQRQGRALHPDRAARMGLRPSLPHLRPRAEQLPDWLHRYNWHRPHGGIKSKPPISRLGLAEDNLLRLHS